MEISPVKQNGDSVICSLNFLDCLSSTHDGAEKWKRASKHLGVEREMRVLYNQPHLVAPMKLTVYDQLPATPVPRQSSNINQWMSQSRDVVSRASARTSMNGRRKLVKKSIVLRPQLVHPADDLPLRRRPSFRPLQLSIYSPNRRLSDLPAFDRLSFTEHGEIRCPPRALVRTQSEDLLRTRSEEVAEEMPRKPASMYEQPRSRRMSHARANTMSSIYSTSRPASEYDALHSHPVSWHDLPGLPQQVHMAAPSQIRKTLTPMEEEFSPLPSASVEIDGTTLTFPEVQARRTLTERSHSYLLPPGPSQSGGGAAPSPVIDPGPFRKTAVTTHKSQPSQAASIKRLSTITDYTSTETPPHSSQVAGHGVQQGAKNHAAADNRVSQWLEDGEAVAEYHPRNSSISTVKTNASSSTTTSFAEHRQKRFQFYQLNTNVEQRPHTSDGSPSSARSRLPTPLRLYKPFPSNVAVDHIPVRSSSKPSKTPVQHGRTNTDSTVASSIPTDMLFDDEPEPHHIDIVDDAYSVTTYSGANSRTGTVKSCVGKTGTKAPPAYVDAETIIVPQTVARPVSFDFVDNRKPTVMSPRSQAADVEKLMHELCGQAGYRRVNVGLAF